MFKRSLINFAMIQTVIFATSVSFSLQTPILNGPFTTFTIVWMVVFLMSVIPAIAVSLLFAALSE